LARPSLIIFAPRPFVNRKAALPCRQGCPIGAGGADQTYHRSTGPSKIGAMNATEKTALKRVHRLLFRAPIEMRAQGHEQKNKLVFHLADLFHNAVLDLEAAADGRSTCAEVLRQLEEKAKEKNCERRLHSALAQIESSPLPPSDTSSPVQP
jgi:vacuolar-type H+-ATPase catalytic subunit A/Vma1